MALTLKHRCKLSAAFSMALLSASADASSEASKWTLYRVKATTCSAYVLEGGAWKKPAEFPLPEGTQIWGTPYGARPEYTFLKNAGASYSILTACLEVKSQSEPATTEPNQEMESLPTPGTSSEISVASPRKLGRMASLSYLSWQEETALNSSTGGSYPLQASQAGLCPGMSWSKELKPRRFMKLGSRLELNACLMVMSSQVAPSTRQAVVGANYQSSNSMVFGPMVKPGFFWTMESNAVEFGLSVPLIFRIANWPNPGASYSFASKAQFGVGALVESKFYRGEWFFSPKVGIYKKTESLFWSFEIGKLLKDY